MTVVVAHHASEISRTEIAEAVREAVRRRTDLIIVHVTDSLDLDKREALESGIGDVITDAAKGTEDAEGTEGADLTWRIELVTGTTDIAEAILEAVDRLEAEALVIGSRRRSPIGKAFLGSITQQLLLEASVPVVVVKR